MTHYGCLKTTEEWIASPSQCTSTYCVQCDYIKQVTRSNSTTQNFLDRSPPSMSELVVFAHSSVKRITSSISGE